MTNLRFLLFVLVLTFASIRFSTSAAIESQSKDGSSETSQQEADIVRLAENIKPISYELWIVPDLDKFIFSGTVKIKIRTENETGKIILHSKKLKINRVRVLERRTEDIDNSYQLDPSKDLLIIETSEPLSPGQDYRIVIDFQGVLEENSAGFYRSYYTVGRKKRWLAMTQFEPNHAREAFPCFDDPRFRSSFTIYVARDKYKEISISNMPIHDSLPSDSVTGPNRKWDRFTSTSPLPTNSLAYTVVRDYSTIMNRDNNIRIKKKKTTKQVDYILKQSDNIFLRLERRTNIYNFRQYFPKVDIVVVPYVPTNSSAAGNWGLVNIEERFAVLNKEKSSAQHRQKATQLLSRVLANQWFGAFVSPSWYENEWLKGGFGAYFGTFIAADIEPSWNLDEQFVVKTTQGSLWNEVVVPRAITTPVQKSSQVSGTFDIIGDEKAAAIIRMIEHTVSSDVFNDALYNFLDHGHEKQNGIVIEKNLLDALEAASSQKTTKLPSHISVFDAVKTWTKNIGFPLLNVTRDYSGKKVTVTQTPYRALAPPTSLPDQQWTVPLTYTTKSEANFSSTRPITWIYTNEPLQLENPVASTDWILFNIQHSAYYRVNYDIENWNLLIGQLQQDHKKIHVLNRAQLIDDVYALAHDGYLSDQLALKLTEYLPKETDMAPWYAVIQVSNWRLSESQGSPDYKDFQTYLRNLVEKSREIFKFDIESRDSHLKRIVKPKFLMLACDVGSEYYIQKSLNEYNSHKDDLNGVQPDLKEVVFCQALLNLKPQREVFDNLWETYTVSEVPSEKTQILAAITCASDVNIIKDVLTKIITPSNREIEKQDISDFLARLVTRIPGVTGGLKFVEGKVDTIDQLDDNAIALLKDLLRSVENKIRTQGQKQQLKNLENKFKSLDQKKYGEFTSIIKLLQSTSAKKIK